MSAAGKNACPAKEPFSHQNARTTVGLGISSQADHRHKAAGVARKTACSTERPAWQAWRHAPQRVQAGGLRCWGME